MYVYLVRHAIAFEPDPEAWPDDRERPLTPAGEKRFRRVARGLSTLVKNVDLVLSSPLTRAWQTAEILEKRAGWPAPTRFEALEPGRSPAEVFDGLQPHASATAVALVGHEPSLHELAAYLLSSDANRTRLVMKKGGAACLIFQSGVQAGEAELEWLVPPRFLRQTSRF
jgi:phosphohistidine phosphatase